MFHFTCDWVDSAVAVAVYKSLMSTITFVHNVLGIVFVSLVRIQRATRQGGLGMVECNQGSRYDRHHYRHRRTETNIT